MDEDAFRRFFNGATFRTIPFLTGQACLGECLMPLSGVPSVPSKNFLANHQLDIHWCTGFPYTSCRQYCPQHLVCK